MLFALGCAFNPSDVFANFNYKKLKCTCAQCYEIIGNNHRQILVKQVFLESVKAVIDDIIERNVTFWLPLVGIRKCNMHMQRIQGDKFKKMRQAGKWKDLDILKTNFSGYEIGLFMLGQRTPRTKTVYVSSANKARITQHANEGMSYGDSLIDTRITDYYTIVQSKFPKLKLQDIKCILNFAWKSVYLLNSCGGDLEIRNHTFWCYMGTLKKTPLQHFAYYRRKLSTKIRVRYRRAKSPWDGYYYFALTDTQYKQYLEQKNSIGRPRKYFNFGAVILYEIPEDCKICEYEKRYIFRIKLLTTIKLKYFVKNLRANAELVEIREPLKFKDLTNNETNDRN